VAATDTIAIYGKSGHGKVVADIAMANGFSEIIWVDDDPEKENCISYPLFLEQFFSIPVALGIGNNHVRKKIFERLENDGCSIATLIHPSAVISPSVHLSNGTVVMPLAVINADSVIGEGSIINSATVIEHDCNIGAFSHISPNAALAGNVSVGSETHIGIGASVIQGITIGNRSIIAAGSVVIHSLPDAIMAVGIPAQIKKEFE